ARQICVAFARIAWKIGSRLREEELITVSTSAVAACCSSASLRSRVSRATFVSLPAAGERRPRVAFGANVLRRCVLASLPPILERRFNCSPEARERSSYQLKVAFRKGLGVRRPMSALAQKQTFAPAKSHVRFTPEPEFGMAARGAGQQGESCSQRTQR